MTTGVAAPVQILRYCDNRGNPLVGGQLLTQVGGVNTAVYSDQGLTTPLPNPVILNSRGEVATAAGASSQMFMPLNVVYTFTLSDSSGNQIWVASYVNGSQLSAEEVAALAASVTDNPVLASYARSAAEVAAGVTPVNYSYPSDQSLIQALRYNASTSWDYRTDQRLFEIYLSKYGAVFNGTTDDSAAIGDAINAIFALWSGTQGPRKVFMPCGGLTAAIKTAGAISLYCGAVGIDFNGMLLNATTLTSGNVFNLVATGASPYAQYADSGRIQNFSLLGPTTGTPTTVMLNIAGSSPEAGQVSGAVLRGFNINGGAIAIQLNQAVYILTVKDFTIQNQLTNGIYMPLGVNSGEKITFTHGQISNVTNSSHTGTAIYLPASANDASLRLIDVSLDYSDQVFNVEGGQIFFSQCYIENNQTANPVGSIALTSPASIAGVQFDQSEIAISESTAARANWFTIAGGATTRLKFNNCRFAASAAAKTTAQLVNITDGGSSVFGTDNCTSDYVQYGTSLSGVINRVYNGGAELGNLNGWTTTATSPNAWSASTTNPHSGAYSISYVATAAANGTANSNPINVRPGQQIVTDAWIDITAYTQGAVEIYVQTASDSAFTDVIDNLSAGGPYSATTGGYVEANRSFGAGAGANFARIAIDCSGSFEGTVYFDDLKLAAL